MIHDMFSGYPALEVCSIMDGPAAWRLSPFMFNEAFWALCI